MARNRIEIIKDDPAECGCNDAYKVIEKDAYGHVVRIHGRAIKSYEVARNIAEVARGM